MKGVRVMRHSMMFGLAVLAGTLSTLASAQAPADLTGVYKAKGGELAVLQAENESLVYYSAAFPHGSNMATCECRLALQKKKSATEWALRDTDTSDPWTLRLDPKKLELQSNQSGCCGAGWPGSGPIPLGSVKPLQSCKVKASRAYFYAPDAQNTQRKNFVVSGDSVEAYASGVDSHFVLARFKGSKKATAGLIKREELDCPQQASTAPSTPPPGSVGVASLAGKWTGVEREGEGYVIREHCESHTPRFSLKPGGDLDMDYGREQEHLKVTGVQPGAAGAYTLELKHDSGSKERVEWTVSDAKHGIVQLKGSSTFPKRALFVRDDKKASIPKERQGCDESEEE